jgi:hypothetical protein
VRFLVDEMFPRGPCSLLVTMGHDAVHVRDLGLDARPDAEVAAAAVREARALVTENVKDFAGERDLVLPSVLKSRLPGGGMASRLADLLDAWALANPAPYVGQHWP